MDFFVLFFVIFVPGAVIASNGQANRDGNKIINVQLLKVSEDVNVTCGDPFGLSCTANISDATCVWNRNGTVIQSDTRYFLNSTLTINDFTVCSFYALEAYRIDQTNWTCGTQGNDQRNGSKSRNISVRVLSRNGTKCSSTTTTTKVHIKEAGLPTWQLVVYASTGVVTALLIIGTVLCCKRKIILKDESQEKSPEQDDDDDDYIDGFSMNPNEEAMVDATSLVRCYGMPSGQLRSTSSWTAGITSSTPIRICEIRDVEGYQVATSSWRSGGSRTHWRESEANSVIRMLTSNNLVPPPTGSAIYFESGGANGVGKFIGKISFVNSYEDINEWTAQN